MSFRYAKQQAQDESLPRFQRQQYAFTAHMRSPEQAPAPSGIEDRRLAIYRELLFNNVKNFLDNCFPVFSDLLGESMWLKLCRHYFAEHAAQSPLFNEINAEFVEYLAESDIVECLSLPAFSKELAHYEWMELVALIAPESVPDLTDTALTDSSRLSVSPVAFPLAYQFDVQRIGESYQPEQAPTQPTFLVVYRKADDEVHFLQLNVLSFQLLNWLQEHPQSELASIIAHLQDLTGQSAKTLEQALTPVLNDWLQRHIILA